MAFLCIGEVLQRLSYVGAVRLRLERNQLADDMQHVALAFLRRNEFLYPVGEEEHAHFIVVLYGGEG